MTAARNSRVWRTIPVLIGVCLLGFPAQAQYSGGTGEPDDPYQIATAEDLMRLGETPEDYDKHFMLTGDIDLDSNLPEGRTFDQAVLSTVTFVGVFDGNGHVIHHMQIVGQGDCLGLFSELGANAEVMDLGLEDVVIFGNGDRVGALAAVNRGWITSCYSTGTVQGDQVVGGLVGQNGSLSEDNSHTLIHACYSRCSVNGLEFVGGLAGFNLASLTRSYSIGPVTGIDYIGGLVVGLDDLLDCFWNTEIAWQAADYGGTGLTTAQMQDIDTYLNAGWDFVDETVNGPNDVWAMSNASGPGQGYPVLSWQVGSAEPNASVIPEGPVGMVWTHIPAGSFEMGDHFNVGDSDEKPVHTVTLDAFFMSVYETTNAQYAEFLNAALVAGLIQVVGDTNTVYAVSDTSLSERYFRPYNADWDWGSPYSQITYTDGTFDVRRRDGYDMSDHPVVEVSWYGAQAFCDFYGYRLPTEAEWEFSARGGYHDPYYKYPWGDNEIDCSKANHGINGYCNPLGLTMYPYTSPVGYYGLRGSYGLCDMSGNVMEWCSDWLGEDYYSSSPENNPTGPEEGWGGMRVLRGGAWNANKDKFFRAAQRTGGSPGYNSGDAGFRVCISVSALEQERIPIHVENHSFELPGTEKIKGWNGEGVAGTPAVDIPGWSSDTTPEDSGVEMEWGATDGEWTAFLKGADPSVWQISSHVIGPEDAIELKLDAKNNWGATTLRLILYYDVQGVRLPIASADVELTDVMQEFTLTASAADAPDAVGMNLGVEFDNVSVSGESWIGMDNVRLIVE